jgi:hypothetical protein
MKEKLTEFLIHPLTGLAVVGSAVLSLVPAFGPVWEFVGATSGTWFPLVAVSAGTILPEIGLQSLGSKVLLAAAIVYVAVYADRLAERLQQRLE